MKEIIAKVLSHLNRGEKDVKEAIKKSPQWVCTWLVFARGCREFLWLFLGIAALVVAFKAF